MVELQAGEGGMDSKLFVVDLANAYLKYGRHLGFSAELLSDEEGHAVLQFGGKDVWDHFQHEAGKHCIQRVSPTERNGRKHTSMVAVALLPLPPENRKDELPESELEFRSRLVARRLGARM